MKQLSIIVVTKDDSAGLRRTLRSLRDVPGDVAEVLVCDGGSSYPVDMVVAEERPDATLSSLPDLGIYDAMNRGLASASGRYVWFLNGGDEKIASWSAINSLMNASRIEPSLIMCGFELSHGGRVMRRRSRSPKYLAHALPTSHQAILYNRELGQRIGYDLSYTVSADYAFTVACVQAGCRVEIWPETALSRFHTGGLSSRHMKRVAIDADRVHREMLGRSRLSRALSRAAFAMARARMELRDARK